MTVVASVRRMWDEDPASRWLGMELHEAADVVFVASAREGDHLEAIAAERTRAGRNGVYDVTVRRRDDDRVIAEFRGRSRTIEREST